MIYSIKKLVAALPEIYQPIFGHPQYSNTVSRQCHDRLEHLAKVYKALESQVQRPLRVLDLGCAQGFFSLSLAKLGATVHGVDYLDTNIAVCNALASENPKLNVSFQVSRIESILEQLQGDQYDLVLGLSVFHHIVHEAGVEAVQQMLADLADKIAAGIFELALASEPLYWAAAQPQQPWQLLSGFAFVHELTQHETHLSDILRPLYFASNRYWCLNDQCGGFNSWQTDPHVLAQGVHQSTRRYYFGNGLVVKLFRIDHAALGIPNLQEYRNEVAFLLASPPGFNSAQLVLQGQHEREVWLVRTKLPGELLIDIMRAGNHYDARLVLGDILSQLATLEAAGLYHNDVRAWNVLVGSDGHALLIDYGAIVKDSKDCVWPHDIFLGFLIFVHEITTGVVESPSPLRAAAISPYRLAHPYREWALSFWSRPSAQWSFKLLHELFMEIEHVEESCALHTDDSLPRWMQAIEEAVDVQIATTRHLQLQQQQVQAHAQWLQSEWDGAQQKIEELSKRNGQLEAVLAAEQQKTINLAAELSQINEQSTHLQIIGERRKSNVQLLQNEWDVAQQKIEELSKRNGQLEAVLAAEQQKTINLAAEFNAVNELNTQLQTHTQWLQSELNAVSAKVQELNNSSHHWWSIADSLNQELKTLYASRSWSITKPLRLLSLAVNKIINCILAIPKGLWFAVKFPFKLMLAGLIHFILKRPKLKVWALAKLRKHPGLEAHLSRFARLRGIALEAKDFKLSVDQNISVAYAEIDNDLTHMTPRAHSIYADLKAAIENHSKESNK